MADKLNYYTLAVFSPLLIVTGILGFIVPANLAITSGATVYNIFHIIFGIIGLLCFFSKYISVIRLFNGVFGVIDIYQLLAAILGIFPLQYFLWKSADNILHALIGTWLIFIALYKKQGVLNN